MRPTVLQDPSDDPLIPREGDEARPHRIRQDPRWTPFRVQLKLRRRTRKGHTSISARSILIYREAKWHRAIGRRGTGDAKLGSTSTNCREGHLDCGSAFQRVE